MKRLLVVTPCLILALAACDNRQSERSMPAADSTAAPALAPVPPQAMGVAGGNAYATARTPAKGGESYVYDHNLSVSMASPYIKARFERARDRCQQDLALKCRVTAASFQILGEPGAPLPVANLTVALPHEGVEPFVNALLVLLPGESADDLVIRSRTTTAENVTNQVRDIESRLGQLKNYRSRMEDLARRRNASTEDLIRIEGELSRTQGEIEQIDAQRRDLAERIARENVVIAFEAQSTAADAFQPVREVWQGSLRILAESTANAIGLVIGLLPWIPVLFAAFFALRYVWRRARKA